MRKEKYIEEKYSTIKGEENTLIAYVVNMPLSDGNKHYKRFRIIDYKSEAAALKDARADRDAQMYLNRIEKINRKPEKKKEVYTVQQLFDLISVNFDRRKRTYDSYDKQYDKYIKGSFADKDIRDINEEDILSTLTLCSKNCSTHYVSKLKTLWKKLFIIAQRKRVVQMNLVDIIESPKSDKVTERSLNEQNITESDFQAFCEAMSNYGHYLPWEEDLIYNRNIMLYLLKVMRITGMRSQEGRAVKRDNIVFAEDTYTDESGNIVSEEIAYVCVRRSIGSTRDEYDVEINTKTPQSIRDIPVSGDGVNLLKEVLNYSKHDLLFARYDGTPISSDEFSDYLYRVSKSCGIKVYSLLMRKSFSADLYREGVNPAVTKRLMGHKKEDMSLNAYATTNKEELLKTAKNRKFKS